VSRKICYKWINRFKEQGIYGLKDKSKRPHSCVNQTPKEVEEKIVALRMKHPQWGARKLRVLLKKEEASVVPSSSTITTILHRYRLIAPEKSEKQKLPKRFEYNQPNELWQMDFKGHFKLLDNAWCYPLTILDDHSRFNICLSACLNQRSLTVREQLIGVFRRYGLPDKILSDNGSPWGTAGNMTVEGDTALSVLAIWLMRLGIQIIHGRPYHPQTQGKEERFHRTLKTDLLQFEQFKNAQHCQLRFDKWRNQYNLERPHEAIGFKTPSELYSHSKKSFPECLPEIEYLTGDEVRRVCPNGYISYQGRRIKLGKGLIKQFVAIRHTRRENVKEVYYCNQKLKDIIL
jgi:transposase InsO family protein